MLKNFTGVEFHRIHRSSGEEKEYYCLVFTYSTKREIRHFHFAVVQRRQRNVHVQSCYFAYQTRRFFSFAILVAQAFYCYELPTYNKDLCLNLFYSHWV